MARDDERTDADEPDARRGLIDPIDTILAAALIACCAYLYYVTTTFPGVPSFLGQNVLPEEFPQILLVFIGLMALLLPFEHKLEVERWPLIAKSRSRPIGRMVWLTMAFILAIVSIASTIGTVLTIFASSLGLPVLWGERRWALVLSYAVLFTLGVSYVFSVVLKVYFEPGVFGVVIR